MRNPENNSPDSNHYSSPVDVMVIVDLCKMGFEKIIRCLLGRISPLLLSALKCRTDAPILSSLNTIIACKRTSRTTTKPYHVIQPEGASFTVKVCLVEWEKRCFRVGFNWREG
ncbi:copper amine oxidase [Penicillium daleae]|uniref:Copper amine oxidase n=1 Tax=Penicillium daleae TaxID=63821 RepID=A0AAD6C823_9EURO|nr:copper amine oxidase [Penicillium daleae]KAJ5450725.1 copper amine oxidase [Penicillium daleae]